MKDGCVVLFGIGIGTYRSDFKLLLLIITLTFNPVK